MSSFKHKIRAVLPIYQSTAVLRCTSEVARCIPQCMIKLTSTSFMATRQLFPALVIVTVNNILGGRYWRLCLFCRTGNKYRGFAVWAAVA